MCSIVAENKKKDKKEDDSANRIQTTDTTDAADDISNGIVANMETEKIDTKQCKTELVL